MRSLIVAPLLVLAACGGGLSSDRMSSYDIEGVLKQGGSITISASRFSSYDAQGMAKAAVEGGSILTIRDASGKYSSYDMEGIGKAGPGHVKFE